MFQKILNKKLKYLINKIVRQRMLENKLKKKDNNQLNNNKLKKNKNQINKLYKNYKMKD